MAAHEGELTWGQEIRELRPAVEHLEEGLNELARWASVALMSRDCFSVDGRYPEPFATIFDNLCRYVGDVRRKVGVIEERYADPVLRALQNWHLTEEQFHVVRAAGLDMLDLLEFPSSHPTSAQYRVLEGLYYRGERLKGYINMVKRGGEGGLGLPAEACSLRELRPEQEEYFRALFPEVYARFKE